MKEKFENLVDHLMSNGFFLVEVVELLEKTLIARTIESTGGNRSEASKRLGIHRNTLQRKIEQYQIGARKARRKPLRSETRGRRKSATA